MSRSTKKSSIETGETSQESGGVGAFARTLGEREHGRHYEEQREKSVRRTVHGIRSFVLLSGLRIT